MSGFFATVFFFVLFLPDVTSEPNQTCGNDVKRMEALPGEGWDALLGRPMSRVLAVAYKECRLTEDREFLIPDDVYVTAIKESEIKISSKLIDHWNNYTSVSSESFDAGGSYSFGFGSVSGSFSTEYQNAKTRQVEDKSVTMRTSVRVNRYALKASLTADVDERLMKLLMETIERLENDDENQAEINLELIVRQYGTHFITEVSAGAILLEETYFSREFLRETEQKRDKISISASANFLFKFSINAKYSLQQDESVATGYTKSQTSDDIRAIGGDTVRGNMTVDEWIDKIPNNLVVIDRSGLPLTYLINRDRFPHVNITSLEQLVDVLEKVIKKYYTINSYVGCMSPDSPNFDFNANVDSGSCLNPLNNYSLGGAFLTCQPVQSGNGNACDDIAQKNPVTGSFTCLQNHSVIPLTNGTYSTSRTETKCWNECHSYWIFWKRCRQHCGDVTKQSTANYEGFWCFDPKPANNSGQMFGGIFTSYSNNPVTKQQTCPTAFIPVRIAPHLIICISDDYEVGALSNIKFGGFFSCRFGNPLYKKSMSLMAATSNSPFLPGCPQGFSQHTATVDEGCEIKFCTGPSRTYDHVKIIRPPFRSQKSLFTNYVYIPKKSNEETETLRSGPIIGIVIACLIVLVSIVATIVYARRRRRRLREEREAERDPLIPSSYSSIGGNDSAINVET